MEKEDKILEAIARQHADIKAIAEQSNVIIKKLEKHDDRFDRLESAVLENSRVVKETQEVVKENSKDIKEVKQSLDTAVTNHEQRIRTLEQKAGV